MLACSGGLDSTVLAHVLHAEGYDFAIAHMNFQLRGEASDGDAAFVEELARTLGAKFYCKAVDVRGQAKPGESTQMTARRLRYDWFQKLIKQEDCSFLSTAHHADDSLETMLINLIRGTGLAGLTGIPIAGVDMRRPLLDCSRAAIQGYAHEHNLEWREDASNQTDDYLRNRIRHQLTPLLKELGLTTQGWIKTSGNLRDDHRIYGKGITSMLKQHCDFSGGFRTIHRHGWRPQELESFMYSHIRAVYNFTPEQIRQMLTITGPRCLSGTSYMAYITPDKFRMIPLQDAKLPPLKAVAVVTLPYPERISFSGLNLKLVPRPDTLEEPGQLFLAPPTLPLHLRPRQKGDRFQPLGLGGKTKKIKDYMIDEKIPVWLRDRIYLLVNDQDEIMAIPGYCISEKFKVLPEHDTVLRIGWN